MTGRVSNSDLDKVREAADKNRHWARSEYERKEYGNLVSIFDELIERREADHTLNYAVHRSVRREVRLERALREIKEWANIMAEHDPATSLVGVDTYSDKILSVVDKVLKEE